MLRKARDARGRNRAPGAPRHVVKNAGNVYGVRDRDEVPVHPLFVRLVVVGRNKQQSVRAEFFTGKTLFEHGLSAVRTRTHDDGNTVSDALHGEFADGVVFFVAHRCGFPGRPENDEGVRLVREMKVDQFAELFKINAPVFMKRRNESNE